MVWAGDGVVWGADTGGGYHLVPGCDVARGRSVVVPNPGAMRLHTANGEIDASECVKFSLTEIGLSKQLATILPETPRVLSVGVLCMDMQATFTWPAGGTPYFTLLDGRTIYCEVHGRVPYLRTGSFASQAGPHGTAAMPMVVASSNVVPPDARQVMPLTAPPLNPLIDEAPSAQHLQQQTQASQSTLAAPRAAGALPPALAADDVEDLPALPPWPRPNAALRAEQAEVEDGRDYEADPLVADPPPAEVDVARPAGEAPPADAHVEGFAEVAAPPVLEDEHNVRARKAEAVSLRHLLTHHPKNVYCTTCCRAKCQRAPHRRKHHRFWSGKPVPMKFGDQITADHIVAYSEASMGVTGHQAAVVFGDRATGGPLYTSPSPRD